MSNPTISPGYGFVPCSHDDPKRSHVFIDWTKSWGVPCYVKCDECAKLPARKPVEIPEGWELVPEGEKFQRSFGWISTYVSEGGGVHVPEKAIGVPVGEVADNGDYGCASIRAFIRRKPVQPTVEPSKPAVDWSKPLQTRDGRKARLLGVIKCDNSEASGTHVVASMLDDSAESVDIVFTNGRSYSPAKDSDDDIINAPERIKREVWLNVYQHSEYYGYDSKDEADDCAMQTRVACVRVQIDCEKGEGL
jgi:hypothetical protein